MLLVKAWVLAVGYLLSTALMAVPVGDPAQAQRAHANGVCGSLGPGTGLLLGKGWIVSMLPGKHEIRVRGGGAAYLTAARMREMDFDAGRPYYIVVEGTTTESKLEWKVPGKDWAPIATTFLYPPQGVPYAR